MPQKMGIRIFLKLFL